jgi:hypothetical protein
MDQRYITWTQQSNRLTDPGMPRTPSPRATPTRPIDPVPPTRPCIPRVLNRPTPPGRPPNHTPLARLPSRPCLLPPDSATDRSRTTRSTPTARLTLCRPTLCPCLLHLVPLPLTSASHCPATSECPCLLCQHRSCRRPYLLCPCASQNE